MNASAYFSADSFFIKSKNYQFKVSFDDKAFIDRRITDSYEKGYITLYNLISMIQERNFKNLSVFSYSRHIDEICGELEPKTSLGKQFKQKIIDMLHNLKNVEFNKMSEKKVLEILNGK